VTLGTRAAELLVSVLGEVKRALDYVMFRSAEKDSGALLKSKNQLALDLERLLSHKEVEIGFSN